MNEFKFIFFFLLGTALAVPSFSQKDKAVPVFQVKFKESKYAYLPLDNYLFQGTENRVKITCLKKGVKKQVKVSNGKIRIVAGDSVYVISDLVSATSTLLSIYEIGTDGKSKLAENKLYTVIPFPIVKISGVPSDSILSSLGIASGKMMAEYPALKRKWPVLSYKMDILDSGKFKTVGSVNGKLSPKMMAYLAKLKPGNMIYFKDIRYLSPRGDTLINPIYRIFIVKDNPPLQFGL